MTDGSVDADAGSDIEDLYPLTPLQSGMLFHTLRSERSGPYVEQFVFDLHGEIRTDLLTGAWNQVMSRHPALRTCFVWEGLDEPHQVVIARAAVPLSEITATGRSPEQVERLLRDLLDDDRECGFELERAPLMRLTVLHVDGGAVLVWTLHHLVLDGWSFPRVLRDVASTYRAMVAGAEYRPAQARPFRDFVDWLQKHEDGPAERYWSDRMAGRESSGELDLAPGEPRERRGAASCGRGVHTLGPDLSAAVRATAAAARVTLGTLFEAAWAMMLARHARSDSVTYGLTVVNRPADLPGVEDIVGPFINTVPRCVWVAPEERLDAWMRRLQRERLDGEPFQHAALVDITRWAGRPADEPLFRTILVVENYPSDGPGFDFGGVRAVLRDFVEDTGYALTVVVFPAPDGLRLQILYDEERYGDEVVTTLLGRMDTVLRTMVADPAALLRDVDVSDNEQWDLVLNRWNNTEAAIGFTPLHDLVVERAVRAPSAVALDDHGRRITYAELVRLAAGRAAALRAQGAGPERVIAIMQSRTADLLISALAVLMSGGAYVVLDPDHPDTRLRFVLDDAGAVLLLTEPRFDDRLAGAGTPRLHAGSTSAEPDDDARVPVDPEQLCYVTYTSGSTGRPKGIAMTHGALVNLVGWELGDPVVRSGPTTFCYASLSFDVSFQEMFTTWCSGGTLVLVGPGERIEFERLVELARTAGVERWYLPAFALEQVAAAAARNGVTLPALRTVISGSEPLHVTDDLRSLLERSGGVLLENQYGPSECHVVTSHVERPSITPMLDEPPIGRPIANTRVYVLDDALRAVPVGVTGTIHLAGAGVARGYLRRPGLTADLFVPCPFGLIPGERMYDTGDLGRYRPDGSLEFLGRNDSQVKIRGIRVELGEIETTLRSRSEVRDALAILSEVDGMKRIVGYVVPASGQADGFDVENVLAGLREILPDHMVPWAVVPIDAFPLTVNRKVDRTALPKPHRTARPVRDGEEALSAREISMAALWADVLGVDAVGMDEDFFRLGGDSMIAVQLIGRVREQFVVAVGVGALFDLRTPRRLLERISEDRAVRAE